MDINKKGKINSGICFRRLYERISYSFDFLYHSLEQNVYIEKKKRKKEDEIK